ncbi:MAG: ParB/RepB/Spo0J family partition protein [Oxalobacteraceae bacterium]|nr:ParB/RepB/Spo0J family partition protein [Oxalobacteraceae bacterium]
MLVPDSKLLVPIHEILVREGFNPRDELERQELKRLATSISSRGQLQPLIVRHDPKSDQPYVLIGGHRRLAALELNGASDAWVSVTERGAGDEAEDLIDAVTENAVRVDLSPIEEAQAFQRLRESGRSVKEVASLLGVSQKLVQSRLLMLSLPERVSQLLSRGTLPIGAQQVFVDIAKVSPEACVDVALIAVETERSATHIIDDPLWQLPQYLEREQKQVPYEVSRFGRTPANFAPSSDLQEAQDAYKAADGVAWPTLTEGQVTAGVAVGVAYAPAESDLVLWADREYLDAELVTAYKRALRALNKRKTAAEADAPAAEGPSRAEQAEVREAEAAEARNVNQRVWAALTSAQGVGELALPQARLLVRALIDPYVDDLAYGLAISDPRYVIEPEGNQRATRYDLDAARNGVVSFLEGAADTVDLWNRALILLATAQVADTRTYPPSSRPQLGRLRDSWAGGVAHHLLSKAMPSGRKMPRIASWDEGLRVEVEEDDDAGAES